MKSPVNVAITGAAGQIGYALAFRVASGQMLGAGSADQSASAGNHAGARRAAGRGDGAQRLRVPDAEQDRRDGRCQSRVQGLRRRVARRRAAARTGHGAQGSAARERADFLRAGQGARCGREPQRARARRRQSREHERADRPAQCARPQSAQLHGDGAPRSQPRARAARGEDRHARHEDPQGRRSGAITPRRSIPTCTTRSSTASRRCRWSIRSGTRRRSFRSCSSAARRSSRRAANLRRPRQRRPRSITCATG